MILPRVFNSSSVPTEAHTALVLLGVIALVAYQGFALWKGQDFNARDFGEALAVLVGGGGLAALGQGYLTRARSAGPIRAAGSSAKPDNPDA